MLVGLPQQLSKIQSPSLSILSSQPITPSSSARNLGFIFDSSLSFGKQISKVSSACQYHIRDLRRIRNTLDFQTAATIATSLVHSRLDYCNSLYCSLPSTQLHRLQLVQNALARAVSRTPLHDPISPVLHSLHWLRIEQRIQYKLISITHNLLENSSPSYLRDLIQIQPAGSTRSSSNGLRLAHPKLTSKLKFSDRSFRNASPSLWNALPLGLRELSPHKLPTPTDFPKLRMTRPLFLKSLKTHLFTLSFPP